MDVYDMRLSSRVGQRRRYWKSAFAESPKLGRQRIVTETVSAADAKLEALKTI